MTQADRVHSTPPLSTSLDNSRRGFLAQAAAVTAGGAALATALSLPGSAARAVQAPDPILKAIEAHKAAHAKLLSRVDRHCKLESELPSEQRCSTITAWEEEIVETDDPRWIEAERQIGLTSDAEIAAAYALIAVIPTTRLGLLALLGHAVSHDTDGYAWPDDWRRGLLDNLSEELPTLWQEKAV
ncbi:hypothetical protein [Bradyrhizobium sp. URHC0002]